jgi:2-polyprenyl-6-methoxyphenol hydroxylase-like FAD-dependent oxidoreductase
MPRVLVVGAGIAGLSLAMGLRTRGVSATVVEQAPEIADAGLSIALREPHFQALTEIGYPDSRSWRHFPIRQVMHYDDKGAPVEAGPEGCMFTRGDLRHAMLAPVRDLVRTGIKTGRDGRPW